MALRMLTKVPEHYLVYFSKTKLCQLYVARKVELDNLVLVKGNQAELPGRKKYKARLVSFGGTVRLH